MGKKNKSIPNKNTGEKEEMYCKENQQKNIR